jgi:hypothetical protein
MTMQPINHPKKRRILFHVVSVPSADVGIDNPPIATPSSSSMVMDMKKNCTMNSNDDQWPVMKMWNKRRKTLPPINQVPVPATSLIPYGAAAAAAAAAVVVVIPDYNQPKAEQERRVVRFASMITITTIRPKTSEDKLNAWYGPDDYLSFEMDCRNIITAAAADACNASTLLGNAPVPPSENHPYKQTCTIRGLEDFVSNETKKRRTYRRLSHCYNVLFHQFMQKNNYNMRDDTATIGRLQHISEASSYDSVQLALERGKVFI